MVRMKRLIKALHLALIAIFILIAMTACNSNSSTLTVTQAKNTVSGGTPAATSRLESSASVSQSSEATATPAVQHSHAAVGKLPLPFEVQRADKIFVAQVLQIGELVWTTPDGKEFLETNPSNPTYTYVPEQLAPVEVVVTASFKGNLAVGEKLTILLPGAPNSKPYGLWSDFPKVGDTELWFAGNPVDYRRGLSNNPLISLNIQTLYHLQSNGTWLSSADHSSSITIAQLQQAINSPPPDPKITAASLAPTPRVKAGQAVNLVKKFDLDKTDSIILKGRTVKNGSRITDPKQIQTVISTLDISLTALEDLSPPNPQNAENVLLVFNLTDGNSVSFEYNLKANQLTGDRTDFRVPAPQNLRAALGL